MYRSKIAIERKLGQVKYMYGIVSKFKNRIFVRNGLDEGTDSYPLLTYLSSFVTLSRSILQYAHKEVSESGNVSKYNEYIGDRELFRFFRLIRDKEIHEYTVGTRTTVMGESRIASYDPETQSARGEPVSLYVEQLSDLDSPKDENRDVEILISIAKRSEGEDSDVYEELELDGEKDIFKLCEKYIDEIELFIAYGKENGFIT
jgi:hypothetical protein